ncbi:MAG: glycoside hydrolase family 3 N-terminal domain-containing protein, partial [Solirubrobacterales bacterium]
MPPAVRRRRLALAAVAGVAMVGGAIVGGGTGDEDGREAAPTTGAPAPACPPEIASDARRLIGQTLVVRMEATATESLRRRVRRGEIGGVALFPPAGADPAALAEQLAGLRRAAAAGGMPPPLIAIDQEGGEVERLPELAPDLSPAELATSGDRAAAVREGRATGRDLRRLGANVDLAP